MRNILITGGAGFIGSHLTDELIRNNYNVRIIDNLSPQVHGINQQKPAYLNNQAEFVFGDIRNQQVVKDALRDVEGVIHLAASVGVGQSMYEIENYTSNNNYGTSVLCQCLIDRKPLKKFIVASSMSIYGEGLYIDQNGNNVMDARRSYEQLKSGRWDIADENGNVLKAFATPESKTPDLSSIYALSKYDQEKMCLILGQAYNIPTIALRFFNVFGTRQALSNPYTGVLAIFASRLLNNNHPLIFEDGEQKRDFVSVDDVVQACMLALENTMAQNDVFNIGSGKVYTIKQAAVLLSQVLGKDIEPVVTGKYRAGDIRNCFADIHKARTVLGYVPHVTLESGLAELADWLRNQEAHDSVEEANSQLRQRGLTL